MIVVSSLLEAWTLGIVVISVVPSSIEVGVVVVEVVVVAGCTVHATSVAASPFFRMSDVAKGLRRTDFSGGAKGLDWRVGSYLY